MQTMGSTNVGEQAPDFTLNVPGGMRVTLSDFQREVSAVYGVLNAAGGYSDRALFVIDQQGRIAYKDVSANPGDPAQIPGSEGAIAALRGPGT